MIPARLSENPAPLCAHLQHCPNSEAAKIPCSLPREPLWIQYTNGSRSTNSIQGAAQAHTGHEQVTSPEGGDSLSHPNVPKISLLDPWMALQMLA